VWEVGRPDARARNCIKVEFLLEFLILLFRRFCVFRFVEGEERVLPATGEGEGKGGSAERLRQKAREREQKAREEEAAARLRAKIAAAEAAERAAQEAKALAAQQEAARLAEEQQAAEEKAAAERAEAAAAAELEGRRLERERMASQAAELQRQWQEVAEEMRAAVDQLSAAVEKTDTGSSALPAFVVNLEPEEDDVDVGSPPVGLEPSINEAATASSQEAPEATRPSNEKNDADDEDEDEVFELVTEATAKVLQAQEPRARRGGSSCVGDSRRGSWAGGGPVETSAGGTDRLDFRDPRSGRCSSRRVLVTAGVLRGQMLWAWSPNPPFDAWSVC
jgi:hypothetical protein